MTQSPQDFPPPTPTDRSPDEVPQERPEPNMPVAPRPQPIAVREPGSFRKGFGLGAGLGLGLTVAGIVAGILASVMLVIAGLSAVGMAAPTSDTETIWGGGSKQLRAISIEGTIMAEASDGSLLSAGTYGYEVADELDSLTSEDASGVVLLVNTPGGSIPGSKAIADAIVRYQERTGQKVLVHISSMSASGGVYSMVPADEIFADFGAMIGSIGIVMGPLDQYKDVVATSGSLLEGGVTTTGGITSEYFTAGKGKDFGNPYRAVTEAERKNYQGLIDSEYEDFVDHVTKFRGIPKDQIINELGAFMFNPAKAEEVGLIDGALGRDDFFAYAAEAAGLDPNDTRIEAVRAPSGLESLLGVKRSVGVAPAVAQSSGGAPVLSTAICSARTPLVFAGDVATVCG